MPKKKLHDTAKWDAEQVRKSTQKPAEKSKPWWRKISPRVTYIICVVLVSCLLAELGWLAVNEVCALNKEPLTADVTIDEGDGLGAIAKKLKKAGIIDSKFLFKLYGLFSGTAKKVDAGVYKLDTGMDYHCLEQTMQTGTSAAATVTVTIPEGYTVQQIIELLAENNVSSVEKLTEAAKNYVFEDYSFIDNENLGNISRLEGYLFPDTYEFYVKEEAVSALSRLLDNFYYWIFEDEEMVEMMEGEDLKEIITVASLIEKETDGTDRETIASVIYNRLNHSAETAYLLQIDASLVYAAGREITQDDYKNLDSPYNLYTHQGLPPTPIANPGLASIKAALNPEKTNYYFYALDVNGEFGTPNRHVFSKTLADHNYVQRVIG
ncbi:MAG: endolytic transglycosylase MltG [Clostridiales bacterium]|nr:endolytic transglycosylase MltG [Clostridiales bacterium]